MKISHLRPRGHEGARRPAPLRPTPLLPMRLAPTSRLLPSTPLNLLPLSFRYRDSTISARLELWTFSSRPMSLEAASPALPTLGQRFYLSKMGCSGW